MGTEPARDPLLVEREKTHGSFENNAALWRELNTVLNKHVKVSFPASQGLALNMIVLKIARLVQTPYVRDHWDDIAGYAKLGSEACE